MLQVQNKVVAWYSSVSGNLTNDFNNCLQRTLGDMEKVPCVTIWKHLHLKVTPFALTKY